MSRLSAHVEQYSVACSVAHMSIANLSDLITSPNY
jgi:hypothetical protein